MFHIVYLLQSKKDKSFYIGYTRDVKKRLKEHNQGLNLSTKHSKPWELIFFEAYISQKDARRRERYLKTSQGSRLLQRMIKEYLFKNKKLM